MAYLDLRARFYFGGQLHNFHLLAIPMRERHTGEYQFDLVVKFLDVIVSYWRRQLLGVASDGASAMTGCIRGTVTRLANECESDIFRVWCGAHQLDLVMKKAFSHLCNDEFVSILTGITGYLRRQQNLIAEMKSKCPTFAETRWISMGSLLKWLVMKRIRLIRHFDEKKTRCTPPMHWWIVVYAIVGLVERVEKTFKSVQGLNTLVCEQRSLFSKLIQDLSLRANVVGPLNERQLEELEGEATAKAATTAAAMATTMEGQEEDSTETESNGENATVEASVIEPSETVAAPATETTTATTTATVAAEAPTAEVNVTANEEARTGEEEDGETTTASPPYHFINGTFAVRRHHAIAAIEESGAFVVETMDILKEEDEESYDKVITTYATFALDVIRGTSDIVVERDMRNNASTELPPVIPLELLKLSSRQFASLLEKQKWRLSFKFTNEEIESMDQQFGRLKIAYREEGAFCNSLDAYKDVQDFKACWSPLGDVYKLLREFCGGIATVMPGTSSVEADFSLINWTMDPNSSRLTDFSLESKLHAKQYNQLSDSLK